MKVKWFVHLSLPFPLNSSPLHFSSYHCPPTYIFSFTHTLSTLVLFQLALLLTPFSCSSSLPLPSSSTTQPSPTNTVITSSHATMMRSNSSIPIPRTVPLLPLHDKVLLPGVVTRLQISRRDSIPLFEKILRSYDSKDLNKCIIGVFPVHTPPVPLPDSASLNDITKDNNDDGANGHNNNTKGNSSSRKKKSSSISKSDYGGYPLTDDGAIVGSNAGQVVPLMGGGGPVSGNGGRGGNQTNPPVNPAHIHATGCAARLVRLERAVGGFTVMLEGAFCLFSGMYFPMMLMATFM